MAPVHNLGCITDRAHAAEVLHPLRLEILRLAREPVSASELSPRLGLSRQRVNYHVRRLARSGFLRRAGRRRRRNMIEQRYVASARAFLLSPELLGAVGADWRRVEDTASADFLLALGCQMESDLIRVWREARVAGKPVATLSLKSQFRFESTGQREKFTRALEEAVVRVVTDYTSPNLRPDGSAAPGRPFRLVLGVYPYLPTEGAALGAETGVLDRLEGKSLFVRVHPGHAGDRVGARDDRRLVRQAASEHRETLPDGGAIPVRRRR